MRISGSDNIKRCVDGVWAHDVVREYEDSVYSFAGDYNRNLTMEIVGDMVDGECENKRVLFRISFSSEESLRTERMDNLYEEYSRCRDVCGRGEITDKTLKMSLCYTWWYLCLLARYYVREHDCLLIDAIRVFEN